MVNECERGKVDTIRVWWVQAEAILGLVNEYQKSGDPKYRDAAADIYHYICDVMVDKRPGSEWSGMWTQTENRPAASPFWSRGNAPTTTAECAWN